VPHVPYREPAPEREWRTTPVEVRATSGGNGRTITGLAVVFGQRSQDLGGFVEVVSDRFLAKSAGDQFPNVTCTFNHDASMLLGTVSAGTLRLNIIEGQALQYDCDTPESRSDVRELISRHDVTGSSFSFRCFEDSWQYSGDAALRTLLSGQLLEVSPVVSPAYSTTTASMRSLARAVNAPIEDILDYAARDELRKFFRAGSRPMSNQQRQAALLEKRWPAPQPAAPLSARHRQLEVMARRWTTSEPSGTRTGRQALVEVLGRKYPPTY
jgi:HK97 family phage prohead protease